MPSPIPLPDAVPKPEGAAAAAAREAARLVPAEFAQRHALLPLSVHAGILRVASAAPLGPGVVDDLRLLTGLEVTVETAGHEAVTEGIAERYQVTVERMVSDLDSGSGPGIEGKNLHDIEVMANEPTVVNLVNVIISAALRERASDIHLIPFESAVQLRYRIDGLLQEKQPPPKPLHAALVSRIKIMADMNIAERFLPQDGHIQINHRGARVDIRVGTLPTIHGESVVMRLLEKDTRMHRPEDLGLDPERAAQLRRLTAKPHGLFLATGPTGSGKTTTLYAILQASYTTSKKIITIEDPVEYELHGVAQIPVKPGRGFTFATGLRAILRQDPNVVMVGEIRDAETAEIAIRAALTGHQVLSTLHTNDAAGAVTRLIDMGIEPFLVASSLDGVLAQRLVRRICPSCRTPAPPTAAVREQFPIPDGDFWIGAGCDECRGIGYRGRVGLFELLEITPDLRELILQRRSSAELKASVRGSMTSLFDDGMRKAAAGITSLEEIVRVCSGDDTA
ncbi:MAG: type II/IV secretion system protein [Verrucomicrobia bacterium]|nr:MAG: type II/IV secretion system protein [Verrucomicrobiota bacterium]